MLARASTVTSRQGWEQLPSGWSHGDVAGVATDSQDRVYVFNRSEHPLIIYDQDGKFLGSWGDGPCYPRPHGITITRRHRLLADDTDHTVRKFTLDGKVLMTLGTPGQPSDTGYSRSPGNLTTIKRGGRPVQPPDPAGGRPERRALRLGRLRQRPIHRFTRRRASCSRAGARPGTGPASSTCRTASGSTPTAASGSATARTTASRSSARTGELLRIWGDVTRPGDLFIDQDNRVYVGEMAWEQGKPNLAGRIWPERPRRPS